MSEPVSKIRNPLLADRDWVWEAYVEQRMSIKAVAELAGASTLTVSGALAQHKIPTREGVEQVRIDRERQPGAAERRRAQEQRTQAQAVLRDAARAAQAERERERGERIAREAARRRQAEARRHERERAAAAARAERQRARDAARAERQREQAAARAAKLSPVEDDSAMGATEWLSLKFWLRDHAAILWTPTAPVQAPSLEWLVAEYVDAGRGIHWVADECGADIATVTAWVKGAGIAGQTPILARLGKEYVASVVRDARTLRDAAESLGVAMTALREYADQHGVDTAHLSVARPRPRGRNVEEVREVFARSATYQAAGEALGVSRARAQQIAAQFEVELAPRVPAWQRNSLLADRDWLAARWVTDRMSAGEVAEAAGATPGLVADAVKHYGLRRHAARGKAMRPGPLKHPLLADREWLREQYVVKGRTAAEIGAELGVTKVALGARLRRFGIDPVTNKGPRPVLERRGAAIVDPVIRASFSYREAARTLGVDVHTVMSYAAMHDVYPEGRTVAPS